MEAGTLLTDRQDGSSQFPYVWPLNCANLRCCLKQLFKDIVFVTRACTTYEIKRAKNWVEFNKIQLNEINDKHNYNTAAWNRLKRQRKSYKCFYLCGEVRLKLYVARVRLINDITFFFLKGNLSLSKIQCILCASCLAYNIIGWGMMKLWLRQSLKSCGEIVLTMSVTRMAGS